MATWLEGVRDLVHEAEPGSYVSDTFWGRELLHRCREFVCRADFCWGDCEPGKLHFVFGEVKFARVQGDSVSGANL